MNQKKGKVSFPFYYNWEEQLLRMNLEERWNFIHNLIKFHTDREISFISEKEEMAWIGIKTGLLINIEKYKQQIERSQENGKKGGRPSNQITQQVNSKPTEPDNSKQKTENSKELKVNSEELMDNSQISNDNGKVINVKSDKELDEKVENENTVIRVPLEERLGSIENWKEELVILNTGKFIDTYEYQLDLDIIDKIQLQDIFNSISPNE